MSVISKMASFENDIDFPKLWRIGIAVSVVLVVISVGSMVTRGLNLGIDFEGGTAWLVDAPDVSVSQARDALGSVGASNAKIQVVGSDTLRVQAAPGNEGDITAVSDKLAELAGVDRSAVAVSTVGPTWGDEISSKAERALFFFFVLIAAYIAIRLEWKMAMGALVAVLHDIVISVGVYSVFQFEVTPATVIAFLTIMGYSLYDTIVVYDKVQENASRPAIAQKMPYTEMMSLSLNQVLMRSLNTSITSLLPVVSMLVVGSVFLGAVTLQEFSLALLIGLASGAYSSVFVATPFVAWIKEREPYYRNLRARLENQGARRAPAAATADQGVASPSGSSEAAPPELSGRVIPPRPRKKGKRR